MGYICGLGVVGLLGLFAVILMFRSRQRIVVPDDYKNERF